MLCEALKGERSTQIVWSALEGDTDFNGIMHRWAKNVIKSPETDGELCCLLYPQRPFGVSYSNDFRRRKHCVDRCNGQNESIRILV